MDKKYKTGFIEKIKKLSEKTFILYYHNVGFHTSGVSGIYISPGAFNLQMRYLKFRGYRTIRLGELVECLRSGIPLPKKVFAITFDDAFQNNYRYALPILRRYGYTATVFVPTAHAGRVVACERSVPEQRLTWDEMRGMSPEWDFGSHTVTHAHLCDIPRDEVRKELAESRSVISKELGKDNGLFCYTFGQYNDFVVAAVKETGYKAAVTTHTGFVENNGGQDVFLLPRFEWKEPKVSSARTIWNLRWLYVKLLIGI